VSHDRIRLFWLQRFNSTSICVAIQLSNDEPIAVTQFASATILVGSLRLAESFRCHDSGLADVSGLVSAFLWGFETESADRHVRRRRDYLAGERSLSVL